MTNYVNNYKNNIINYDLINKFTYKNKTQFPKIKTIIIHFKTKNFAATFLALELIIKKKSLFTTSKKPNIFLKIQKGQPIGCKIMIKKTLLDIFLSSLILEIFPKLHNNLKIKKTNHINQFSIKLKNKHLMFLNIKEHYNLINLIPYITIIFLTNTVNQQELVFLLKSYKINLHV